MGIFTEAIEKQEREAINAKQLPTGKPIRVIERETESSGIREFVRSNNFDPSLVLLSAPDSLDAENFRNLRAQILFPRDCERRKVIMVTSVFPGEGKTYVATNLGVSIAMGIHEHVLLVDCDLRRPAMHKMFGYPNTAGLHELLTGQKELKDLIIRTKIDKLSLLPGGAEVPNPSELLSSEAMRESLKELKARYDDRFIIIDSTPSQIASEANVLSNYVDGIIFVIMAQRSHREVIQKSIADLGKEKILGIIFNGYKNSYKRYNKYYKKYSKSYCYPK